ncbi:hypothetical protein AAIA72_10370 [Hahella sp. SMD15-11]|uniref:Secreted protein n=1 Tax=Thermohahella caldifontis TaxID=3142973 RepID=A0AB39UTN5_9GAMM
MTSILRTVCLAGLMAFTIPFANGQDICRSEPLTTALARIRSPALPETERSAAFENLANRYLSDTGTDWLEIKDAFLTLMTEDPQFFFSHMATMPSVFGKWLQDFQLNWNREGEVSDYPERKALALKSLQRYLERLATHQQMATRFRDKLEATQPQVVD